MVCSETFAARATSISPTRWYSRCEKMSSTACSMRERVSGSRPERSSATAGNVHYLLPFGQQPLPTYVGVLTHCIMVSYGGPPAVSRARVTPITKESPTERSMTDAFIYDAVRTPRGKGKKDGSLHQVTPIHLVANC